MDWCCLRQRRCVLILYVQFFGPLTEVADLMKQRWLRLFGCITGMDLILWGIEDHTGQCFVSQNKLSIKVSAWDNTVIPCTVSSIARLILSPRETFALLPHCCWLSVLHGWPPSMIRPSLLLLPLLETVCLNRSRPHPICLFSKHVSKVPLQAFLPVTLYCNLCGACAVTVVIFGCLNHYFYIFTYLEMPMWTCLTRPVENH